MDTLQYVQADVRSGATCWHMFGYTDHNDMDAPPYVQVDVPSQNFC